MSRIWKLAQECGFDDFELLPMLENFASKLAALQSAQPAEVSDEEIDRIVWEYTRLNPNQMADSGLMLCIRNAVRAILALRPQAVPMTEEQSELVLEVERLRGLLKLESLRDHSHQCLMCLHPYTPVEGQSEDCPSCGFDGITQRADGGEVE